MKKKAKSYPEALEQLITESEEGKKETKAQKRHYQKNHHPKNQSWKYSTI